MRRTEPPSLLQVAIANAGMRRGVKGASFALEWSMAVADVGDLGGGEGISAAVRQYCEWWRVNERTAWRRLDDFRAAFPGQESPAAMAVELAPRFAGVVEDLQGLDAGKRRMAAATSLSGSMAAPIAV